MAAMEKSHHRPVMAELGSSWHCIHGPQWPIFGRLYRSDGTIIALIGVNSINHSFGKSATRLCSGGAEQCWKMRTNNKSPNCTTRITALVIAKAG